jgi:hypothetical protein
MNCLGAVWSLNGDTEIKDEVSCELILNVNGNKSDTAPLKRKKLSVGDDQGKATSLKSPEVIDENPFKADMEDLVNIHGKICAGSSSKSDCSGDCKTKATCKRKFDAIKMPIGSDFMGECPVLNLAEKVSFSLDCKNGEGKSEPCGTCPFSQDEMIAKYPKDVIEKCPFLKQQQQQKKAVDLIDYEENEAKNGSKIEKKSLITDFEEIKLYCGLYCHSESVRPAFEKCENLGIELAKKLIEAKALEVMKIAQDEIHSKA